MSINKYIYNSYIEDIKIVSIFINKNKNIENTIKNKYTLANYNILEKNELINLINKHKNFKNKNYKLFSILKYNIDLDLQNIKHFIKYPIDFLSSINEIRTIDWIQSCKYLNELNTLFIIFIEKTNIENLNKNKKTLKYNKNKKKKRKKTRKKN